MLEIASPPLLDGVLQINSTLGYSPFHARAILARLQALPGAFCYKNSFGTSGLSAIGGWTAVYEFHWTAPTPKTTKKGLMQTLIAEFDHDPDFDFIKTAFHTRKAGPWRCGRHYGRDAVLSLLDYEAYDAAVAALSAP